MKIISDLVNNMDDEIEMAKIYAQNFLIYNADNNVQWADRFRQMAYESVDHADVLHQLAVETIEKMQRKYVPPEEMVKAWKKEHVNYVNTVNWIRDMIK